MEEISDLVGPFFGGIMGTAFFLVFALHLRGGNIKMRMCVIFGAILALVLMLGGVGFADLPNELDNPCFEQGGLFWETSGSEVQFNAGSNIVFDRPHIAYDPGGAWLRQICDNTKSPLWNDNLHNKKINLSFDVYNETGTSVDVYIDYLPEIYNSYNTKPTGVTYVSTYVGTYSTLGWTSIAETFTLNTQPRWCGPRFVFNLSGNSEAAVDATCLRSECIPEPSSWLAIACGLIGIAGIVTRRRH